jgi:flavin reductase (DIM6/NTAB) family NADH-FMN oxidoreductase RutF
MARLPENLDFPVSQVWRYLEPGPIVMVLSALNDGRNIMTTGWRTVMEFTPSLVGCVIAGGNYGPRLAIVWPRKLCSVVLSGRSQTPHII